MDLADVHRPQLVTPLLGLAGDLLAHGLAHVVARLQHLSQRHVAQAPHSGVAEVGPQGASRIGILEQESHWIVDPHLVPDADAHGRPFFGIDRLAAQVLLVEPEIQHVAGT